MHTEMETRFQPPQMLYQPFASAAYGGYPPNGIYSNVQCNGATAGGYQQTSSNMNYGPYQAGPNIYAPQNSAFMPMSVEQVPFNIMVKPSFKSRYAPYRGQSNNELNVYMAALVDHVIAQLGPVSAVGHYSIIAEILSNVGEVLTPYCKTIDPTNMTYQEFVATIKDNYAIVVHKDEINLVDQFFYAERDKNESLAEFAAKLKTLAKKAYPNKTEEEINEEKNIYKRFVACMPEPIRIYIDRAINNARISGCHYVKNWSSLKIMIQNIMLNMGEEKVSRILKGEGCEDTRSKIFIARVEEDGTMTFLRDFEEKENLIPSENVQSSHTLQLSHTQPQLSSAQVSRTQVTHSSSQSQFQPSQHQPSQPQLFSQSQHQPSQPQLFSQSQHQLSQPQKFSQPSTPTYTQHTPDMTRQITNSYSPDYGQALLNSNVSTCNQPSNNNSYMAEPNFNNNELPPEFNFNDDLQYPPLPINRNLPNFTGQLQSNKSPVYNPNNSLTLSPSQIQDIVKQSLFNQQETDRLTETTRGYKTCTVCGTFSMDHPTEKCPLLLKACVFCKEIGHTRLLCRKEAQIYCKPNNLASNFNKDLSHTLGNFQKKWLDQPKIFDQYNIKSALADLLAIVNNFSKVIKPPYKFTTNNTPNQTTAGQYTKKDNFNYCPKAGGAFQKTLENPRINPKMKKPIHLISSVEKSMMNPYSILEDELKEETSDHESVSEDISEPKNFCHNKKSEKKKKIKGRKTENKIDSPSTIEINKKENGKFTKSIPTKKLSSPPEVKFTRVPTTLHELSLKDFVATNLSSANFSENSDINENKEEVKIENMVGRPKVFECFITIGEESTIGLIDSGAGQSSIRMDLVQKHNLPFIKNEDSDLKSFGLGCQVTIIGHSFFSPQLHDLEFPEMKFRINKYKATDYPVVLGRDFLEANQVVVDPLRSSLFRVFPGGSFWGLFSDTRAKTCRRIVNKMPIYCKEKDPKGQTITLSLNGSGIKLIPNPHCACNLKENKELQELNNLILVKNESFGHLELIPEFITLVNDPFCVNIKIQNREGKINNIRPGSRIGTACSLICTKLDSDRIQYIYNMEEEPKREDFVQVSAKLDSRSPPTCELNQYDEPEQVRMDSTWNEEQMEEKVDIEEEDEEFHRILKELLWKNQELFYSPDYLLESGLPNMNIHINSGMPICISQPKQSNQVNDLIEKKCHELMDKGILEPSDSQYNSPIYAVRNPKGEVRLILDFRNINKKLIEYEDPLEDITSFIESTSNNHEVFSTLTLFDDFNQLSVNPKSRDYISFSTALRKYRFRKAVKECHYTPIAFHLALKQALGELLAVHQKKDHSSKIIIHENAIIIMSSSKSSHVHSVSQVLEKLAHLKLKLSLTKSHFGKLQLNFRGQLISHQGFQKDPKYIDKFLQLKKPEYVGDLIRFLEYLKWVEKFVPEYQLLISEFESVIKETKRNQSSKIAWTTTMEDNYEEIKKLVATDIAISLPESGPEAQEITIYSDSSTKGAGGVATQLQKGEQRILGIYSFRYGPHQMCYSVTDLELTSIKLCLRFFKPLIYGRKVNVLCDHSCLQYLSTLRLTSDRLLRTIEEISSYNCTITYYPGLSNMLADSLSRLDMKLRSKKEDYNPKHEFGYLPNYLGIHKRPLGGGDSMIVALNWRLEELGETETPESLRNILVNEILDHPKLYCSTTSEKNIKYWEKYRNKGEICPDIFLQAFANLYKLRVQVFFGEEFPVNYLPVCEDTEIPKNCILQCVSGIHYNLLKIIEEGLPDSFLNPKCVIQLSPLIPVVMKYDNQPSEGVSSSDHYVIKDEEPNRLTNSYIQVDCDHFVKTGSSNIRFENSSQNFCLSFDTSIPYSIMSQQVFQEITSEGECNNKSYINLIAINSEQNTKLIKANVVEVKFTIGKQFSSSGKFLIVPDNYLDGCVIMGMELMSKNSLSLDFSKYLLLSHRRVINNLYLRTVNEEGDKLIPQWKILVQGTETTCLTQVPVIAFNENEKVPESNQENRTKKKELNLRNNGKVPADMSQIRKGFAAFKTGQLDTVEFIQDRENLRRLYNDCKLIFPTSQAFKDEYHPRDPETYIIQCQDSEGYYDHNNISVKNTELIDVKWLIQNNVYKWPRSLSHFWKVKRNLILIRDNKILGYKEENNENIKIILPKDWIINYIIQYHKLRNGHISANKIYHEINDVIYYPNLLKLIREITSTCPFCQLNKTSFVPSNPSAPIYKINPESAFHTIQLDLNVQDRDSKTGMKYILVCVDLTSKWLVCATVRTKTGKAITAAFKDKILPKLFALPSVVSTDGGREFDNREFKELLDSFGMEHRIGVANFHASKGGVERVNRTLRSLLKVKMEDETKNSWNQYLGSAVFDYNHLYHSAIQTSPQKFLLQGVHFNNPNPVIDVNEENTWKKAAPGFQIYSANSRVLKQRVHGETQTCEEKRQPSWSGPYRIVSVGPHPLTYVLKHEGLSSSKKKLVMAHHSQLCLIKYPTDDMILNNPHYREMWKNYPGWIDNSDKSDPSIGIAKDHKIYKDLVHQNTTKSIPLTQEEKENISEDDNNLFNSLYICNIPIYKQHINEQGEIFLEAENRVANDMYNQVDRKLNKINKLYSPILAPYVAPDKDNRQVIEDNLSFSQPPFSPKACKKSDFSQPPFSPNACKKSDSFQPLISPNACKKSNFFSTSNFTPKSNLSNSYVNNDEDRDEIIVESNNQSAPSHYRNSAQRMWSHHNMQENIEEMEMGHGFIPQDRGYGLEGEHSDVNPLVYEPDGFLKNDDFSSYSPESIPVDNAPRHNYNLRSRGGVNVNMSDYLVK